MIEGTGWLARKYKKIKEALGGRAGGRIGEVTKNLSWWSCNGSLYPPIRKFARGHML